jgi:hypothetical protein
LILGGGRLGNEGDERFSNPMGNPCTHCGVPGRIFVPLGRNLRTGIKTSAEIETKRRLVVMIEPE